MATERFDKGRSVVGMTPFERPGSDIRKMGYLKKLKTNKKKYFVLRSTSSSGPARLEYYDSEKKFRNGQLPKRSIQLHTLLNINKKWDSKHKYSIALFTKDDCFSVMAEDEGEQEDWYLLLLDYQCEYLREDENRREHFDHVWQVTIQPKGLGVDKKLRGNFRLCLSSLSLSLVRVNSEKPQVSFQLATVRSLAHNDNLFRMEVGSWAPTGAGELWMHVEDSVIAQSMHEAILNCMKAATSGSSFDESDGGRFDKRADTITSNPYRNRPHSQDFRPRTVSESHTQSPRRTRAKQTEEPPRPISIVYPNSRSTSLPADTISPGTSPHMHIDLHHCHRFRSDSAESRASRSSMHAVSDDLSPMEFPMGPSYPDHTTQVIDEEDDYMDQEIGSHDFTSVSSSPGEAKTPLEEDTHQASPYIDMHPTNTTPPMTRTGGYVPMTIGQTSTHSSHEGLAAVEGDAYMTMNPGRIASEPIPIGGGGGYLAMDMSHSSHLPTVREGGSNEGYLPMTPNSGMSPCDASHLRPDPTVCMLSGDSSEIHRRTQSLGSRPPTKGTSRIPNIHDPVPIKHGIVDNDGRSTSAPHLITNRGRSLNVESPTPSASPLSMSFKSESSYRSDDSDSFMELDFHRPRTASDSHGYRPRASSFGKTAIQTLQGHRPRSSSYGQGVRTFKLRHGARIASHESVRTTSQELLNRSSIDSLSHRSSRDSLRVSSSESLRKLSEELRTKTNLLNTDYIDMSMEKRKTPSPQPPNRGRENGYMDMTIGSRTTSPSRSKSSHDSGNTSKSQSSEMLHVQGHPDQTYINIDHADMTSSSSSGSTYTSVDNTDQGPHTRHSVSLQAQGHGRSDSKGSLTSSGTTYTNVDNTDQGPHVRHSVSLQPQGHGRSDSKGSLTSSGSTYTNVDNTDQGPHVRHSVSLQPQGHGRSDSKGSLTSSGSTYTNVDNTDQGPHVRHSVSLQPQGHGRSDSKGSLTSSGSTYTNVDNTDQGPHVRHSVSLQPQGHGRSDSKGSLTSSGSTYTNVDNTDQGPHARHSGSLQAHGRSDSKGSDKHPKPVAEDMYVMYEPSSKSGGSAHPGEEGHQAVTMRRGSGSTDSLKKKARQSSSGEKSKSREHRHKGGGSSSKRKSQIEESKLAQASHAGKRESSAPADEYIEFAPAGKSSSASSRSSKSDKQMSEHVIVESEYVRYQPGAVSGGSAVSKPQTVKSFFSSETKQEKGPSKSASGDSRVTSASGLTSSKSGKQQPESQYVLSSPIRSSLSGSKGGSSVTSDYVLSSPMSGPASGVKAGGQNDKSDYVLSSPVSQTTTGAKPVGAGDASDYVLSSPAASSTPVYPKVSGKSSDYMMASPFDQTIQSKGDAEKKQTSVSQAGPTASQKKSSSIVPQFADSAFSSVDKSKRPIGGHEGTSVDPPPQPITAKHPSPQSSQEVIRPVESSSSDVSSIIGIPKPQSKVENVKSPLGNRREKKSGRTKHYSGNSGSSTSSVASTSPGQGSEGVGMFLDEPGSAALTRPGSTPCMLSLDESKVKPVPAGATLKVDTSPRGRHSISDLSAYEQMTFPSNTLSSSQQQSSSNTLSTSQQGPSTGSEKVLNYASLDLGSSETVGEGDSNLRSPRIKSRHSSAADEKGEPPLSYAQIDFEKSENLKSATGNKDVKFTL